MGKRFPEYDEWLAAEKVENEEHGRPVKEPEGDPKGLLYALEKPTGKKAADVPPWQRQEVHLSRGMGWPARGPGRNRSCYSRAGRWFPGR